MPRHTIPTGPNEYRVLFLLQKYHPLPLTAFDISEVLEIPASAVWPILRGFTRDGVLVKVSAGNYAAKEGRDAVLHERRS